MALTETHEVILYCGDQIDNQSEGNYATLRADLVNFINDNVREDRNKIGGKHERDFRKHIESDVQLYGEQSRPYYCGQTYPDFKKWFYQLVSEESMNAIRKRLELPSDPTEGDCL